MGRRDDRWVRDQSWSSSSPVISTSPSAPVRSTCPGAGSTLQRGGLPAAPGHVDRGAAHRRAEIGHVCPGDQGAGRSMPTSSPVIPAIRHHLTGAAAARDPDEFWCIFSCRAVLGGPPSPSSAAVPAGRLLRRRVHRRLGGGAGTFSRPHRPPSAASAVKVTKTTFCPTRSCAMRSH